MPDRVVYKITPKALWAEAEHGGIFKGAPIDHEDGYIHLSTAAQVAETARRYFAGQADLLLVAVAVSSFGAAMRWEPSRGGDLFPHLYGDIPMVAVRWIRPLDLAGDGSHRFPDLEDEI